MYSVDNIWDYVVLSKHSTSIGQIYISNEKGQCCIKVLAKFADSLTDNKYCVRENYWSFSFQSASITLCHHNTCDMLAISEISKISSNNFIRIDISKVSFIHIKMENL